MSAFSWNKVIKDDQAANPPEVGAGTSPDGSPSRIVQSDADAAKYEPQSVHDIKLSDKYKDTEETTPRVEIAEDALPVSEAHIDEILLMAVERKASDIH